MEKETRSGFQAHVPLPIVAVVVTVALTVVGYSESKGLQRLEPKPPKKTSCVACHTDRATLTKLAEKANDPLYLVHTGDLTLNQLNQLMRADDTGKAGPIQVRRLGRPPATHERRLQEGVWK